MKELRKNRFKAKEVNEDVLHSRGDYGVPRIQKRELTVPDVSCLVPSVGHELDACLLNLSFACMLCNHLMFVGRILNWRRKSAVTCDPKHNLKSL